MSNCTLAGCFLGLFPECSWTMFSNVVKNNCLIIALFECEETPLAKHCAVMFSKHFLDQNELALYNILYSQTTTIASKYITFTSLHVLLCFLIQLADCVYFVLFYSIQTYRARAGCATIRQTIKKEMGYNEHWH